jgi:hypothetical protein
MVEEADRSLHDALSVLSQTVKETRIVLGGGCSEMAMANAVDEEAKRTDGKKALAVESFARALRQVRLSLFVTCLTRSDPVADKLFQRADPDDLSRQRWIRLVGPRRQASCRSLRGPNRRWIGCAFFTFSLFSSVLISSLSDTQTWSAASSGRCASVA